MSKVVKVAFHSWARSQGFRPIYQQCRTELGTALLRRRKGKWIVECHTPLDPSQTHLIAAGATHGYTYTFGVSGLTDDEILKRFRGE